MAIPSLSKDQYQVVAQVDQTIWDGGSTRSARALTRAEAIANREQLESELYALNDRVNQIYFGCLLQDELIRQNALLQKELQVNIERIKAMMDIFIEARNAFGTGTHQTTRMILRRLPKSVSYGISADVGDLYQ